MKKSIVMAAGIIAALILFSSGYAVCASPPAAGDVFPALQLPVPSGAGDKSYLGIRGGDTFMIPDVKAKVVLIEVLSMYCPFCQREAPHVNDVFALIEKNPDLRNRIKVIGIGAGNSLYETQVYREKYGVPFPVIPDGDYMFHKVLGEVRTPYFIGINNDGGIPRVFFSKLGGFQNPAEFFDQIVRESGL